LQRESSGQNRAEIEGLRGPSDLIKREGKKRRPAVQAERDTLRRYEAKRKRFDKVLVLPTGKRRAPPING